VGALPITISADRKPGGSGMVGSSRNRGSPSYRRRSALFRPAAHFKAGLGWREDGGGVRYDRSTMTQVWIGVLIAGAAGIAGLIVKRWFGGAVDTSIDVGTVSQGWLSEQRAGKREDHNS
jgi:hypothetical protein